MPTLIILVSCYNVIHAPDCADIGLQHHDSGLTSIPSWKVGQIAVLVSIARRKSRGFDDDLVLIAGAMAGALAERQVVGVLGPGQDLAKAADVSGIIGAVKPQRVLIFQSSGSPLLYL